MRYLHFRCLLILVIAVVAVACGGSEDNSSGVAGDVTEGSAESATASVVPQSDDSGSDEPKDLDDYLGSAANLLRASGAAGGGRGGGGGAFAGGDTDQLIEEQRLIEQEVQICMQAQGFTYVPEEVGDGLQFFLQAENEGASPADYAATEGFGISTRFDAILDGDVDLTDDEDANPNDEHLATLSDGEADAWQLALQGLPPERNEAGQLVDPETGEVIQGAGRGVANGGCRLEAQTNVRGDFTALGELSDEFAELTERIESDPRVAEIRREWVDCMLVEGFDYTDEDEARADMQSQVRPLLRSFFASASAGGDGDGAQQQQQGGRAGGGNLVQAVAGLQLSAEQEVELEALQELERSVAVASFACQGDTEAEIELITASYEAEFVEANRDVLEAFGA